MSCILHIAYRAATKTNSKRSISIQPIIIDVREPVDYYLEHIEGALSVPLPNIMAGSRKLADVSKDTPLVLYCRTGSRANVALQILRSKGYTNLTNGICMRRVQARYGLRALDLVPQHG